MNDFFSLHTARTSVLFQQHLPTLEKEFADFLSDYEERTKGEAIFRFVRENSAFVRKGYKVNLNKFHSVVRDGGRACSPCGRPSCSGSSM